MEELAGDVKQDLPITVPRAATCKLPILRRPPESYSILGLSEKNVMADSSMSETLKMVLTAGRIFQSDPCSALTWQEAGDVYNYSMMLILEIISRSQQSIFRVYLRLNSGIQSLSSNAISNVCLSLSVLRVTCFMPMRVGPSPAGNANSSSWEKPSPYWLQFQVFKSRFQASHWHWRTHISLPCEVLSCSLGAYAFPCVMLFLERLQGEWMIVRSAIFKWQQHFCSR